MFKHRMEIVHNHGNGYRDWLFYQNVFSSIMSFSGKGFKLKDYLEVYSLNSDQVFL